MTRKQILETAEKCVNSDRNEKYGSPEDNFAIIGAFWSTYVGKIITASDVAAMMGLLKIARIKSTKGQDVDSWVDLSGYGACGGGLISQHAENYPVGGEYES